MKATELRLNPNNPRIIKDEKFRSLVESIKDFPKMLDLRPIVIDDENVIVGGNMRYKALIELGYTDFPDGWVKRASEFSAEELREFVIKDNVPFGAWDWGMLANEWDAEALDRWGLDVPDFAVMPDAEALEGEDKNKFAVLKITFASADQLHEAQKDIEQLLTRKFKGAYFSVSAGEI